MSNYSLSIFCSLPSLGEPDAGQASDTFPPLPSATPEVPYFFPNYLINLRNVTTGFSELYVNTRSQTFRHVGIPNCHAIC